jgi:hypothetical protein
MRIRLASRHGYLWHSPRRQGDGHGPVIPTDGSHARRTGRLPGAQLWRVANDGQGRAWWRAVVDAKGYFDDWRCWRRRRRRRRGGVALLLQQLLLLLSKLLLVVVLLHLAAQLGMDVIWREGGKGGTEHVVL